MLSSDQGSEGMDSHRDATEAVFADLRNIIPKGLILLEPALPILTP